MYQRDTVNLLNLVSFAARRRIKKLQPIILPGRRKLRALIPLDESCKSYDGGPSPENNLPAATTKSLTPTGDI